MQMIGVTKRKSAPSSQCEPLVATRYSVEGGTYWLRIFEVELKKSKKNTMVLAPVLNDMYYFVNFFIILKQNTKSNRHRHHVVTFCFTPSQPRV